MGEEPPRSREPADEEGSKSVTIIAIKMTWVR